MTLARSKKILIGMQEIVDFTGISKENIRRMSEPTPEELKKEPVPRFPAEKILGTWYAHTDAIEDWLFDRCYPPGRKKKSA